jgi:hypothetical protein
MKRKNSRYRAMPFSARVVEPINKLDPHLFRFPPAREHGGVRVRKIFVIKKVQRLPATTVAGKKIQRILIFDNHPDSLRLVLGRRADSYLHLSDPGRTTSSGVALLWILVVVLMMAMFWPIL